MGGCEVFVWGHAAGECCVAYKGRPEVEERKTHVRLLPVAGHSVSRGPSSVWGRERESCGRERERAVRISLHFVRAALDMLRNDHF